MPKIGEIIKELRLKAGYESLGELNRVSGISVATLSRIESGVQIPSPKTLKILAPFLSTQHEDLMRAAGYLNPDENSPDPSPVEKITAALVDDPELFDFWQELKGREDLRILFKQVKPLSEDSIRRIIKYIKIVEDEIAKER